MSERITFVLAPDEEHHVNEPQQADWLPVLGPTSWLLARLIIEQTIQGRTTEWDVEQLAARLGVGGSCATVLRAVKRLERFRIIHLLPSGTYAIRRGWGTAPRRKQASR